MSFNNDEDGDGLAALFGGITPTPDPAAAPGARPAPVAQPPAAAAPVAPPVQQQPFGQPAAQQPAAQGYPPQPFPTPAPEYRAPGSYDLPPPPGAAPAAASPEYAAPQYPGLSPAAAPTFEPQYPGLATEVPSYPPAAPQQQPLAAGYPATAQYPGLEQQGPPTGFPPAAQPTAPASYDLPAPPGQSGYPGAGQPLTEPPSYSAPVYEAPVYDAPVYETPVYATPVFESPGRAPASMPPAAAGQPVSYDLPAPVAAPSYETPYEPTPTYAPTAAYPSASPEPPATAAPSYGTPSYETPSYETRSYETPSYDQPAYAGVQGVADQARAAYGTPTEPPARSELAPTSVAPAGPLLPTRNAAVETPEDLERATAGERIGVAVALLTGPIGLIVAIVSAIRGGRRRGWLIGISRVSLVLGVLSTIATVIVGVILWNIRVDQMQHDELAAASAEFCAAATADPSMVTPTTLGWPSPGNSIPESIDSMTAWTTRWTDLAATSPAELRTGLELLAEKGQTIVDSVTTARSIDDTANRALIASAEVPSGVADWYSTYCVSP